MYVDGNHANENVFAYLDNSTDENRWLRIGTRSLLANSVLRYIDSVNTDSDRIFSHYLLLFLKLQEKKRNKKCFHVYLFFRF